METTNDDMFDIIKCLPEEICDNIFGKLESRDLLKASLVSPEWYKNIAKSAACMQKLTLKLSSEEWKNKQLVERILMNSDRKYENIELYLDLNYWELVDIQNILLTRERKWKKGTITRQNFPKCLDFINFIAFVEPFAEELKLEYIVISTAKPKKRKILGQIEQQKKSLVFRNLKLLQVNYCHDSIFEVFQDVATLTEFNFPTSSAINAVQKMIRCNIGLKKVSTSCRAFDQILCAEVSSEIIFKLTSLTIYDTFSDLSDVAKAIIQTNFNQFLKLHMNTLETLSLAGWMGHETVGMIFHMSKLKHLSLNDSHRLEQTLNWKETSFKESLSLTSLDLVENGLKVEALRAFISAAPNVKKIKLFSLDDESIACISELLPNLESLSVDLFKVLDVTNKSYLPNLREFSMERYVKRIKESEAEEDRSEFESLFLAKKKTAEPFFSSFRMILPSRISRGGRRKRQLE